MTTRPPTKAPTDDVSAAIREPVEEWAAAAAERGEGTPTEIWTGDVTVMARAGYKPALVPCRDGAHRYATALRRIGAHQDNDRSMCRGVNVARIRTIKPEFWSSPNLPDDPWARLTFIAMWNYADDYGRGDANLRELLGFVFPNDDHIDSAEFRRILGGVRRHFGVVFYKVGGRPYYAIPSWEKHQKIDKRSVQRRPGPEEGEEWDPTLPDQRKREHSEDPAETPPGPRRDSAGIRALDLGSRKLDLGTEDLGIPPSAGAVAPNQPGTELEAAPSAQTLVGEWIDHCNRRPPNNVVGQVAKHIRALLEEGFDVDDIRRGLAAWHSKGLHPSTLPSVVNEVVNSGGPSAKPSTTDQRVAAGMALVEHFARKEGLVPEGGS